MRNETKTWQIGDGLWSSSYGGELHAISADQTLRTRGHSTERTAACARFLRNEAKKHSCFQTDDTRWAPRKRTHAPSRAYNSGAKTHRRAGSVATCSPETWAYSASVLAEQKRVCALLAQGRELLKQMQAD